MIKMFNLQFSMDNAAFDGAEGTEVARILREIASQLEGKSVLNDGLYSGIRCLNGNTVGQWFVEEEAPY